MEKYFVFEAYTKLINVLGAKEKAGDKEAHEVLRFVHRGIEAFVNYVSVVDMEETQVRIAYSRLEGEDLRDAVERADRSRRIAHEGAISQASVLNRICGMYGVNPIFTGDVEDRWQVAEFCGEVVSKIFKERKI